jgi:hypothetical protein
MKKINFVNNDAPYLSAENLNQMQDNIEGAINSYTKSVDANGWTVIDFGTYKEYYMYFEQEITLGANLWNGYLIQKYLPIGMDAMGDAILTGVARASDAAIDLDIGIPPSATMITINGRNHNNGDITCKAFVNLRITEFN